MNELRNILSNKGVTLTMNKSKIYEMTYHGGERSRKESANLVKLLNNLSLGLVVGEVRFNI